MTEPGDEVDLELDLGPDEKVLRGHGRGNISLDLCPDEMVLRAYAHGKVASGRILDAVKSHLLFCPSCRQQRKKMEQNGSQKNPNPEILAQRLMRRQEELRRGQEEGPVPGSIWRARAESDNEAHGPLLMVLHLDEPGQEGTVRVAEVSEQINRAIETDYVLEPRESGLRFLCMVRAGNLFSTKKTNLKTFAGRLPDTLLKRVSEFCSAADSFNDKIPLSQIEFLQDGQGNRLMRRQGITSGLLVTNEDDPRLGFLEQSKARTAYLSKASMEPLSEKVVSIDRKKNVKWFVKRILPLAAMIAFVVVIGKSVQIFTEREPSPETSAQGEPGKKRAPGERASQRGSLGEVVPQIEFYNPVEVKRSPHGVPYSPTLPPSQMDHMLLEAAKSGDLGEVKQLLQAEAFVNCRDSEGQTPLIIAVRGGYLGTVKLLLESGAATGMTDKNGKTALDWAVATRQKEAADLLTDYPSGKGVTH